ncbi:Mitochondrial fission 1 protein A [Trifolium repens]|nr:Mitochondrial fission 1 protein A [Trifolium repens]
MAQQIHEGTSFSRSQLQLVTPLLEALPGLLSPALPNILSLTPGLIILFKLQSQFLQIAPDWRHALTLKEAIEERITKDGVIGIGIVATAATAAVGLIATGIATSVSRKRL